MEESVDRLSSLPDALLLCDILSRLPIRMVVRMSILSTRWRSIPSVLLHLDFDDEVWDYNTSSIHGLGTKTVRERNELMAIIDQFMEHHRGPHIKRFRLCFNPSEGHASHICRWLKQATTKGVEEIDLNLNMNCAQHFNLPRSILDCKSVSSLKLKFCSFRLPLRFKGLRSLRTLYLKQVHIADGTVKSLLSYCRQLGSMHLIECNSLQHLQISSVNSQFKSLTVVDCWNLNSIEIDAPDLQSFQFAGNKIIFQMKDISGLQDVLLNVVGDKLDNIDGRVVVLCQDPKALLFNFDHVKVLTVSGDLLQTVYSESYLFANVPITTQFHNMKELQIPTEVINMWHLSAIALFMSLSPCLEKVFIDIEDKMGYGHNNGHSLGKEFSLPIPASPHLKTVKIKGFRGLRYEMELMNYFLQSARTLGSMVIVLPPECEVSDIIDNVLQDFGCKVNPLPQDLLLSVLANLLSAFRTSSEQEITVFEYSDDMNTIRPTHLEVHRFFHLINIRGL